MTGPLAEVVDAAVEYTRFGYHVIPLHGLIKGVCTCSAGSQCSSAGKHPIQKAWGKHAIKDPAKAESVFSDPYGAFRVGTLNLGLPTGQEFDLAVLDVDPKDGGLESLQNLLEKNGDLPETVVCVTGSGGYHYYFEWPKGITIQNSAGKLAPGLDIRGKGGQVVAPPSLHRSGSRYAWRGGSEIDRLEPAAMPEWLLNSLQAEEPKKRRVNRLRYKDRRNGSNGLAFNGPIPEGSRNETLFKAASSLRAKGMGDHEISQEIHGLNAAAIPPLSDREVDGIIKSACRYAPGSSFVSPSPRRSFRASKDGTVQESGTGPSKTEKPSDPSVERNQNGEDDGGDRKTMIELLTGYYLGTMGPDPIKLTWREGAKAYSERDQRLISCTELKDSFSDAALWWVLERAHELEDLSEKRGPKDQAMTKWRSYAPAAFFAVLGQLQERVSDEDNVQKSQAEAVGDAFYGLLCQSLNIVVEGDRTATSILAEAFDCLAPSWIRLGKFGAFVRRSSKGEPFIAIRYDFIQGFGNDTLKAFKRKSLASQLDDRGIAKSHPIRESGGQVVRCYCVNSGWLSSVHGIEPP